jgi:hypothetical protein
MRRRILGPEDLNELGKAELLSAEGTSVLPLILGVIEVAGANVELDVSAFFFLATRDGLRCILLSKILFCCTRYRPLIRNRTVG